MSLSGESSPVTELFGKTKSAIPNVFEGVTDGVERARLISEIVTRIVPFCVEDLSAVLDEVKEISAEKALGGDEDNA